MSLTLPGNFMVKKGLFIVFEGIDGSGKSTQIKMLYDKLSLLNMNCHLTAEPSKRPIGRMIRDVFSENLHMDNLVVAGLFVADRLDHLLNQHDGMLKMLNNQYHVLCDRYYLSSMAYQSVFAPMDWIIQSNALSRNLLKPDITFYLDADAELSLQRIHVQQRTKEIYETLDNLQKVRANYFKAIELFRDTEKIIVLNANDSPDNIAKKVWEEMEAIL